jgi:hypothetical protein
MGLTSLVYHKSFTQYVMQPFVEYTFQMKMQETFFLKKKKQKNKILDMRTAIEVKDRKQDWKFESFVQNVSILKPLFVPCYSWLCI